MSDGSAPDYWAAAARALSYLAITGLLGAATRGMLLPGGATPDRVRHQLRWIGLTAAALFLAAQGARLWAQAAAFVDPGAAVTTHDLGTFAFKTSWGRSWQVQSALGLAALAAFAISGGTRRLATVRALVAGLAGFWVPMTGHAASHPAQAVSAIGAQGLHVVAVGVWFGTLVTLLLAGGQDLAAWPRFSRIARVCAGLVIVTGLFRAYQSITGLADLSHTAWGQTLLLKTGLVLLTGAVGLLNWRMWLPAALRHSRVTTSLRRAALLELALAGAVLIVTGWLSGLPPGVG